jgi:hypothetical protein
VVLASCRAGLGQGCLAGPLYRPLGGRWPAGRGPVLVLGGAVLASGLLEPIAGSAGGLLQAGPEVGPEGADELADLGPFGQPAGGLGNPLVAFAASPGPQDVPPRHPPGNSPATHVAVRVFQNDDRLVLEVEGAGPSPFVHLADRVGALGGRFTADASVIRAEIPCA